MEALKTFLDSISSIVNIVITSIVDFFNIVFDAVQYVVSAVGFLPSFLLPFFLTLLTVFIIKTIVGR